MAKFAFIARRGGSQSLYYKRPVPKELHADGRPKQIWRSLKTPDRKKAEKAYAAQHAEIELLLEQWRKEDQQSSTSSPKPIATPSASELPIVPLTPGLLRRLADIHYQDVFEADFKWRGELWTAVEDDEEAFWRGDIVEHPKNDGQKLRGQEFSYYDYLMGEPELEPVFLYCLFQARKSRLQSLRQKYKLGDSRGFGQVAKALLANKQHSLSDSDFSRLTRKLMQVEIKVLEDLSEGDESKFDPLLAEAATESTTPASSAAAGELMSTLTEQYLLDTARDREWPDKTVIRKRGELREFIEIAGDKPVTFYERKDGVRFLDIQRSLPRFRQVPPFKGLALVAAANKASQLMSAGSTIELLSPTTIDDKVGTVSLFFKWARKRNPSLVNPVMDLRIGRSKKARGGKTRQPWNIDELNNLFQAPLYVGCKSQTKWTQPGSEIMDTTAKFWVPLIGLYTGMRLGEIIQLQVADVKSTDGIQFFDVTPISDIEADDSELKSLKTASSRRCIPIHNMLFDIGFGSFLEHRLNSGARRLFPDYVKAKDDGSWSKHFSKHFKRFKNSVGLKRTGVDFHSFRHNMEDALRNANVPKDVRDAIQGHGENGVSREYGTGYYVETLNAAIQKIAYRGLDLSHLISPRPLNSATCTLSAFGSASQR